MVHDIVRVIVDPKSFCQISWVERKVLIACFQLRIEDSSVEGELFTGGVWLVG